LTRQTTTIVVWRVNDRWNVAPTVRVATPDRGVHQMTGSETDTGSDEREIRTALGRLAAMFDRRAWGELDAIMAAGVVAYGHTGLDAVITHSLRHHLGGCGPSQHLLGAFAIEVAGDTATSVTQARVFHQGAGERAHLTWECMGDYRDTWARTPTGWRMVTREFDVRIAVGDFSVLKPG
jgi:hypothetical protein